MKTTLAYMELVKTQLEHERLAAEALIVEAKREADRCTSALVTVGQIIEYKRKEVENAVV